MNKAEALEFIGLIEPFDEAAVLSKYKERFYYYRMLYANAPSKVIEKIQQRNLEKLDEVKKILLAAVTARQNDLDKKFAQPFEQPKPAPAKEVKSTVAWLIVHTENKDAETFTLYTGINYIGKEKKESNTIIIKNDPFVSRTHALIKCKEADGIMHFDLYDGDGSKPSTNGVFLNGSERRIQEHCPLRDGDTLQIGTTKLVFKTRKGNSSVSGEVEAVLKTGFVRTVDVRR